MQILTLHGKIGISDVVNWNFWCLDQKANNFLISTAWMAWRKEFWSSWYSVRHGVLMDIMEKGATVRFIIPGKRALSDDELDAWQREMSRSMGPLKTNLTMEKTPFELMYLLFKTGDFPIASHVAGGWVVTGIRFYSGKSPGSCSTTLCREWSQILDSQV